MYDRPSVFELLTAAREHFEGQIVPLAKATNHKLYFQTLVAINVLKIVERELAHAPDHTRAEWQRLNAILGVQPMPEDDRALQEALATRNAALCQAIRAGEHDENDALFAHLTATTLSQLEVANPKYLAMLKSEGA